MIQIVWPIEKRVVGNCLFLKRIKIILKQNPNALIYHTVQVEKNGFIYSLLSNTRYDKKKYFIYFGERVYEKFITND